MTVKSNQIDWSTYPARQVFNFFTGKYDIGKAIAIIQAKPRPVTLFPVVFLNRFVAPKAFELDVPIYSVDDDYVDNMPIENLGKPIIIGSFPHALGATRPFSPKYVWPRPTSKRLSLPSTTTTPIMLNGMTRVSVSS